MLGCFKSTLTTSDAPFQQALAKAVLPSEEGMLTSQPF